MLNLKVKMFKTSIFIHHTLKSLRVCSRLKGNQRDMITKYNVGSSVKSWIGKKKKRWGVGVMTQKGYDWDNWTSLHMHKMLDSLKLRLNVPNIQSWHIVHYGGKFPCSQNITLEGFVTMSAANSQMVQKNYVYIHIYLTHTHMHTHLQKDVLQKNKVSKCGKVLTTDESR